MTACPGGRTVVLTAREEDPQADEPIEVLRVVDVGSLTVARTIALPAANPASVKVLRCRDSLAKVIDVVAFDHSENGSPARLVVTGGTVHRTVLTGLQELAVAPARFGRYTLLATTTGADPALLAVRGDGTRRTVSARTGVRHARIALSPDGRYVALNGVRAGSRSTRLLRTFDLGTGRRIGSLEGRGDLDPVWIAHRLVARVEPGYLRPFTTLQVFDRRLRPVATGPAPQGHGLGVSGSEVVGYAATRLMLATPGRPGEPRKFGALRLAAASGLALLPGARFDP